ncbi:NADH-quinone oxidoreductase subunit J [Candidatus Bathyarchaeota archaeon]|nr:NADH-quinone oxidoreductase subunit J [Candidatus Bathyarchaeota archaeon]
MIFEIISTGLLISACLAIFLDEAIYSVSALACTFFFTSLLYLLNDAIYVAIFQFAVAVGTLAILFLSGEMLSTKSENKPSVNKLLILIFAGALISIPTILLSISNPSIVGSGIAFEEALWDLRGMDVVFQGLVLLTVALGTAIILYEKKRCA